MPLAHPHFRLAPLALAITFALATPGITYAQATVSSTQAVTLSIAAQPLSSALNELSAATGTAIGFSPALVSGKTARAVRGELTAQQAVDQMLSGSGLLATQEGGGIVIKAATRADDVPILDAVTVSASQLGLTTEGTGSYTTGSMNTATPLSLSIRETPQSVSVVTRERMTDAGMTSVEDALAFTTGMTVKATGGERNTYSARGFDVSNIQVDGLTVDHDSDTLGSASLAMYDRIEVVRGAAGLLEGAGNPSASINLVRKRPTSTWQTSLTAALGRWDDYSGSVDTGGPLNASGTLRGRVVASLQDADTFTQGYGHKRELFYGIVEADLTDRTLLTLGGYYNKEDNPGADWNGLPTRADGSFYDFDRSVRASPTWSYWNKTNVNFFGELKHTFENDWDVSLKGQYLDGKLDMLGTSLLGRSAEDTFLYNVGQYRYHHKNTSLDLRATGPFTLFGRSHQLAVGANYRHRVDSDGPGGWPSAYEYGFDPMHWQETVAPPMPEMNWMWSSDGDVKEYGAYFTGKFNLLDGLNLFAGGRFSWYELDQTLKSGTYLGKTAYEAKGEFTPYAALTYDLFEQHTVYGSVTGIFRPQNYSSTSGALLDPVEGTNYELGIKGEYLGGRLNTSLAVFQINQSNLPESLPLLLCRSGQSCYAAAGEIRSRGVELEVSGNLTDAWSVFAGYAYQQAEYRKDSVNGKAGDAYATTTPRNLLTLSTVYQLPGALANWRVGASARFQSAVHSSIAGEGPAVRQGAYGIVNTMIGYSPNSHLDLRLNVNNLFDKYYYRTVSYPRNGNLLGEPRSFMLTAQYKF
ncbi:TonB-dependent siderophore receptor [Alcaligenes faecalis]|uniref:TonB-dependent siderophore receptor n=1 Tax=Alcaligenes faecalis TaxID=511 RepID=UPI000A31F55F|nr:TonB-dependent receptor [Alcaligenes faecalis]